jgi:hypothetical protein
MEARAMEKNSFELERRQIKAEQAQIGEKQNEPRHHGIVLALLAKDNQTYVRSVASLERSKRILERLDSRDWNAIKFEKMAAEEKGPKLKANLQSKLRQLAGERAKQYNLMRES